MYLQQVNSSQINKTGEQITPEIQEIVSQVQQTFLSHLNSLNKRSLEFSAIAHIPPTYQAAYIGDLAALQSLVEVGFSLKDRIQAVSYERLPSEIMHVYEQNTAFEAAGYQGHSKVAEWILSKEEGILVEKIGVSLMPRYMDVLNLAIENEQLDMIHVLLKGMERLNEDRREIFKHNVFLGLLYSNKATLLSALLNGGAISWLNPVTECAVLLQGIEIAVISRSIELVKTLFQYKKSGFTRLSQEQWDDLQSQSLGSATLHLNFPAFKESILSDGNTLDPSFSAEEDLKELLRRTIAISKGDPVVVDKKEVYLPTRWPFLQLILSKSPNLQVEGELLEDFFKVSLLKSFSMRSLSQMEIEKCIAERRLDNRRTATLLLTAGARLSPSFSLPFPDRDETLDRCWIDDEEIRELHGLCTQDIKRGVAQGKKLLGYPEALFGLMVLSSDDYLQVGDMRSEAGRFFKIALELPMEMQMLLANRAVGLSDEGISTERTEKALRALVSFF
jgi:hypothetical protein